jgi:hypothetical protein
MGTTAAVLALAGTVIGFIVWLVKRKASIEDSKTPAQNIQIKMDSVHRELGSRDSLGASARLDEWMRSIRNKGGGGKQ